MSIFRAIENRRDIVHNGNSGVTGHISSTGKIIATLPFWKPDYMVANVALNSATTIYTKFGEWFVALCFIGICVLLFFATTKTLIELKEIIKKRFFAKTLETVPVAPAAPSAKKVDEYINNDSNNDLPSLDDIEELVKKDIVAEKNNVIEKDNAVQKDNIIKKDNTIEKDVKNNINENIIDKKENQQVKETQKSIKAENKAITVDKPLVKAEKEADKKIDIFSDKKYMADDTTKSYSIFDDTKYTSDISSTLSTIIEENEKVFDKGKVMKKNNKMKKDDK